MTTIYTLSFEKEGLLGHLTLNGIEIDQWRDGQPRTVARSLNVWARPGVNTLRVRLVPSGPDSRPRFDLSVREEDTEIAAFHWPADAPSTHPIEHVLSFELPHVPPTELWNRSTRFELDDTHKREAFELVSGLHHAAAARDLDECQALLDFKARDVGASHGMAPEAAEAGQRQFLASFFSRPRFALHSITEDAVDYHVLAEDRVLWVTAPLKEPILRSAEDSGPQLEIPVYLARIDGEWKVVR